MGRWSPRDPRARGEARLSPRGTAGAASWLDRTARDAVTRALQGLGRGQLCLVDGEQRRLFGAPEPDLPAPIELHVRDPRFYRALLADGTLGAADAWIRGLWSCSDLTALMRLSLRNEGALAPLDARWARLGQLARRALHALRRNTRAGARRNIHAHYDLGNEFFELLLDPSLTYSCGVFERDDATLEEASIAKYERLCRKLALRPGERVLEIGSGWGGFALHAAREHGCHVTTTTISQQQYALASDRIAKAGLSDRVTLLLEDYRDLRGRYDKLVSIEMIEAVGHEYLEDYFRACSRLLEPHGSFGLQAILIRDQIYERARREVDFIKRYIFPGGHLPSLARIARCTTRATDLRIADVEDLTPHYARTLREWRARLRRNADAIRSLGHDDAFLRTWEFYFSYCEGGFLERHIACQQLILAKPGCRPDSIPRV
jgi:cyclopropane-fatty-acyl-phospholipid synthase